MPLTLATIPLSGSVSGDIDLRTLRKGIIAIAVPTITSGDLLIQGNFDSTSAGFVRLQRSPFDTPTSGDLRFASGPGSLMIVWPSIVPVPSFLRLESGVSQAAARIFTILFR